MCVGNVLKAGLSPIASSTGRAALAGGALGAVMSAAKRKKPRFGSGPNPDGTMSLEPTAALRNSSTFNT